MSQPKLPTPVPVPRPESASPHCPACYQAPSHDHSWTCGGCEGPYAPFHRGTACAPCGIDWEDIQCRACEVWSPKKEWFTTPTKWKVWAARASGLLAVIALSPLGVLPVPHRHLDDSLLELAANVLMYAMGGAFFLAASLARTTLDGDLGHRRRGRGGIAYWAPVLLGGLLSYVAILHGWGFWISAALLPLPFALQFFSLRELGRETCPHGIRQAQRARDRAATFAPIKPQLPLG
jgi:hypothetical protein